jgi:hypothetical protein
MAGTLITAFPSVGGEARQRVYAFDTPVLPVVARWVARRGVSEAEESLPAFLKIGEQICGPGFWGNALRRMAKEGEPGQKITAHAFRGAAFLGVAPEEEMWSCLMDAEWRKSVLVKGDPLAVEMLLDGIAEIAASRNERWTWSVPHVMAAAYEEGSDVERRKLLFGFTVLSSIATDTVSAIQRLVHGEQRQTTRDSVDYWRLRLSTAFDRCPPWVKARLRATLAALHLE